MLGLCVGGAPGPWSGLWSSGGDCSDGGDSEAIEEVDCCAEV